MEGFHNEEEIEHILKKILIIYYLVSSVRIHNVHPEDIQMKTAGLRIRVEPNLRELFVRACQANDQSAAQVLRAYMRKYVENNKENAQGNLFEYASHTLKSSTHTMDEK